ncbi:MAG: S41 family peptidase [Erysipelotrichaceae bacterium]|nr:S41 family peptidase [Erysipelotrichaceae bacterium]
MSEEKKTIQLRMVKHKWEDEIEEEKRQAKKKRLTICLMIVMFLLGSVVTYAVDHIPSGSSGTNTVTLFDSVYTTMKDNWFYGRDIEDFGSKLTMDAINGMVDAQGDPHTYYMTAEEMKEFSGSLENSIVGIGVRYQYVDGCVLIKEVLADSPALTVGLQPGDMIIAVEGVSTAEIGDEHIADAIKGEEGTDVTVTVKRESDVYDITITRAQVFTSVTSEIKEGIGYVQISSFGSQTAEELYNHLVALQNKGVTRLILDVRDNGGGYLNTLMKMSSFFLPKGSVVLKEEMRDGSVTTHTTSTLPISFDKIVLLVNENSASCSEVFASALRDAGVSIVGVTTYGKGTVQVTRAFSDGSALKYTTARWLTSDDKSIDGIGVVPDEEVRLPDAMYESYVILEENESYAPDTVSDKVKTSQILLDFLGYSVDRKDGYFSAKTQSAIRKFQKDQQLEATGILDHTTASALNAAVVREWSVNRDVHDTQFVKAMEIIHE